MSINFGIYTSTGVKIYVGTENIIPETMDKGTNGPRSCVFSVLMRLNTAMSIYPRILNKEFRLQWGSQVIFRGRIEDVKITTTGLQVTAFGYWRALDDILFIAAYSVTQTTSFRPLSYVENNFFFPEQFTFSTQNSRLQINAKKNAVYSNAPFIIGGLIWEPPDGNLTPIVAVQFDYDFFAPVNWQANFQRYSNAFAGVANILTVNGTGAVQTGTIWALTTSTDGSEKYGVQLYFNAAPAVYAGEDKDCYIKISNLRMVAVNTYPINTTYTGLAGGNNHNVGSTVGMYVGQRLHFSQNTVRGESSIILAINSSTQINCFLAKAHNAADAVQAVQVYADDIVRGILGTVNLQNSGQVNSSTALIRSPAIDLIDQVFEDARPSEILNQLAQTGDNASPPNIYEVGVNENKLLYFRPRGYAGQVYYVDVTEVETILSIANIWNNIYATYIGGTLVTTIEGGLARVGARKVRTTNAIDQTSINFIGLIRTNKVDTQATFVAAANTQRDIALNDLKNTQAKASIKFDRVYNKYGGQVPLGTINPGDTFIIRNYPFTLISTAVIDRIKSFRLLEVNYDITKNTLSVTPEDFIPSLGILLRQKQLLGGIARRI